MADFCGFLGEIWVFLWFAPFPAPRNCKILWVISAGIQLAPRANLCHLALLRKFCGTQNWIPACAGMTIRRGRYGGMTIQAVCSVNDSPFLGAELYPPCPMFLCVYKKQLCEFAICGKITENQERIKCRCLTNLW